MTPFRSRGCACRFHHRTVEQTVDFSDSHEAAPPEKSRRTG
jgi:hypothetical protein